MFIWEVNYLNFNIGSQMSEVKYLSESQMSSEVKCRKSNVGCVAFRDKVSTSIPTLYRECAFFSSDDQSVGPQNLRGR